MTSPKSQSVGRAAGVLLVIIAFAATAPTTHAASCDFAPVKQKIDNILDKDVTRGAKFRSEVADGADSITMMESLVDDDMQNKMDICRFQVGEYLTKRGYPPFH